MNIQTVKISGDGFLVNGNLSVPNAPDNRHFQAIERWLLGKTDAWLALEETFNNETAAHTNYIDITTYETRLARYEIDIVAYTDWVDDGLSTKPEEPVFPAKPKGYYTQEEVDASKVEHDKWLVDKAAFVPDESTPTYPVKEPVLLARPLNLVEPLISVLPNPVPNVPETEFTAEQITQQFADSEQAWVVAELFSADVEIRKHEDGAARVKGANVQAWRTYRNDLRDYVQSGVVTGERPVKP